jgi:hypothetical protein
VREKEKWGREGERDVGARRARHLFDMPATTGLAGDGKHGAVARPAHVVGGAQAVVRRAEHLLLPVRTA